MSPRRSPRPTLVTLMYDEMNRNTGCLGVSKGIRVTLNHRWFLLAIVVVGVVCTVHITVGALDTEHRSPYESDDLAGSEWEEITSLEFRSSTSWTVDPTNGDIYLFGGRTTGRWYYYGPGDRKDLWWYNISRDEWTRLHDTRTGPSERSLASLAYDPVNKVLYLAGGISGEESEWVHEKDLWAFDITNRSWNLLVPSLGEYISDLAYLDGIVYGFTGKRSVQKTIKILEYRVDVGTRIWSDVDMQTYQPRSDFASTFDPVNKRYYIFGGWDDETGDDAVYSDLWVLNIVGRRMVRRADLPSVGRADTDLAYDPNLDACYLYGGTSRHTHSGHDQEDLWIYYYRNNVWVELDAEADPGERFANHLLFDPVNDILYMYCGPHTLFESIWRYHKDNTSWTKMDMGITPYCTRYGTVTFRNGTVVLLGGRQLERLSWMNYYYEYNVSTGNWTTESVAYPALRYQQLMATDWTSGRVYVHGGIGSGPGWDTTTWTNIMDEWGWPTVDTGYPRPYLSNSSMAYSSHDNSLYLWGGLDPSSEQYVRQLWRLDLDNETWALINEIGPSTRGHGTMVYNRFDRSLYVYGGTDKRFVFNQLWRYDIDQDRWTQIDYAGQWPSARYYHAAEFHPFLNGMFISGGLSDTDEMLGDLWYYSFYDAEWTKIWATNAPGARFGHGIALDMDRGDLYLFGGRVGDNSLWRLPVLKGIVNLQPRIFRNVTWEDDPFQMTFKANNSIDMTWTFDTNATWAYWDGTKHEVKGTPDNDDVGVWWIKVEARVEGRVYDFIDLTVVVKNTPPTIIAGSIPEAVEDDYWSFDLNSSDDGQGQVTWSFDRYPTSWMRLNSTTGTLYGTPGDDDAGRWIWVYIMVWDGNGGWARWSLHIYVENVNDDPEIITENDPNATRDGMYIVDYEAVDIDPTHDPLTWSMETEATFLTMNTNNGQLFGTPGRDDVGVFDILIRVEDGNGGYCETAFIITVQDEPPDIMAIGIHSTSIPVTLQLRERETMRWKIFVVDNNLAEVKLTVDSDHDGIHIDDDSYLVVDATALYHGQYIVLLMATDDVGATDQVNISVIIEDVNFPPIIVVEWTEQELYEDYEYTFYMHAVDYDGDIIMWADDTPLFDVDPNTGRFSFTPTQAEVGLLQVTFTAYDHGALEDKLKVNFTVIERNDRPKVHGLLPLNGSIYMEDDRITFVCNVTDEENDLLYINWTWRGDVIGSSSSIEISYLPPGEHEIGVSVSDGFNVVNTTLVVVVEEDPFTEVGSQVLILLVIAVIVITIILVAYIFIIRPWMEAK